MRRNLVGMEVIFTCKPKISGIFGKVLSEYRDNRGTQVFKIIVRDEHLKAATKGSMFSIAYELGNYDDEHYVLSHVLRTDFKVIDDNDEKSENIGESLSFIDEYLSAEQKRAIFETVFTNYVQSKMDEIITNITKYRKSLLDVCLEKAIDKYIDGMSDKLEGTLQKKLEDIINDPADNGDYSDDTFKSGARRHLIDMCGLYIQDNKEMFTELMKDRIIEASKSITTDKFTQIIDYKLKQATSHAIDDICKSIMKTSNEDSES